ncbi:hypothetical protein [Chromobacterium amazonense]|nr:hypothetical protein [Chromobacterium amazonense]MDE1714510.1 hypothetical protein [Chromobacterium amazonense]
MKNGVPFHILFDVDKLMPHEHVAFYVTFAEIAGNEFDWQSMTFKRPKKA